MRLSVPKIQTIAVTRHSHRIYLSFAAELSNKGHSHSQKNCGFSAGEHEDQSPCTYYVVGCQVGPEHYDLNIT